MTVDCVSISLRSTAVRRAAKRAGRMETTGDEGDGGRGAICSQNKDQ
jgi:hypothetical protein